MSTLPRPVTTEDARRFRSKHDPARPGNRYIADRRWSAIIGALRGLQPPILGKRYLEIGCGSGEGIARVAQAGLGLASIVGIDLVLESEALLASRLAGAALACADCTALPFPAESFDVTVQSLVLTSILPAESRRQAARELVRVTRRGGHIVSLDLRYPNPASSARGRLGPRGLQALFPDLQLVRSSTHLLLPPVARLLARFPAACDLLEHIPFLRTYHLAAFRRAL